ncbi:MAG: alpha-glucan family phosphorylase [Candidatus Woesearchaeota archaeon]
MIAYFSMEIGLNNNMKTYSGGLGILAGDTLKSAADLSMNMVGVTLIHEKGYFKQEINGEQVEHEDSWDKTHLEDCGKEVIVKVEGRQVKVRAWKYIIKSKGNLPIYFLDTNVEGNTEYDRTLTSNLYGADNRYRLCQEVILGIGGVKMLKELGYEPKKYHMNEGHACLLALELFHMELEKTPGLSVDEYERLVREKCVFTTHTPVSAGHDVFDNQTTFSVLADYPNILLRFIGPQLNTTLLAMRFAKYINGVSKKHGAVSREMFPGKDIDYVTNGVHTSWMSDPIKKILDFDEPENLVCALRVSDEAILNAHLENKKKLIEYVNSKGHSFDENKFTISFARRATGYKRAHLLFRHMEMLKGLDIQIVYAGKAHPRDIEGKEFIKNLKEMEKTSGLRFAFLENYDMDLAKMMVSGSDIWLNTPLRPMEASGTSGMKAAMNGVPNFSVPDGWWIEGHVEGITGWSIGPEHIEGDQNELDSKEIYEKIPIILHTWKDKSKWAKIMKNTIALNGSYFNTHRMIKEYSSKAYH